MLVYILPNMFCWKTSRCAADTSKGTCVSLERGCGMQDRVLRLADLGKGAAVWFLDAA